MWSGETDSLHSNKVIFTDYVTPIISAGCAFIRVIASSVVSMTAYLMVVRAVPSLLL